ncbi:MAG TPA: amino acid adenylation domain-containing protein, partial [Herpetosiphonaceae bacterium]
MNIVEFLAQLRGLGIQLWAEDGRLRYRTAEGALPAELRAELTARKAEILAFLEQVARAEQSSTPTIQPVDRAQPLPLSFAQERLWFIDQWEPGRATYNLPQVVRLRGLLDSDALRDSLSEVVRRHEVLRTTFAPAASNGSDPTQQGRPVQIIHPPSIVALPCHDLRAIPQPERETTAHRLAAEETERPFDLQRGPLLRALLLRTADAEHLLVLTLHHIVSDGWSTGLLIRELTTLYSAARQAAPGSASIPPLAIQYADFAHWQRQWMAGTTLDAALAYWRRQLADAPALLELPTDRPRPARQTFKGAMETALLPAALVAPLESLSQRADATLFMTLLAAFNVLLYRYTGRPDLVVGSPVSGRSRAEIEPLIGCFVNMLPLRIDMSGNPTFLELLQRVREMTLDAYQHQEVPFEKIVEAVQPARTLSHAPIFQVVFMLQYASPASYQLPGLELSPVETEHTVAKFDLELALTESPDGLWAAVEYSTDLFDAATIARLLGHYQTILEAVVAAPHQRIAALPLLTPAEHQQLRAWQGPHAAYPVAATLPARFAAIAARTPHAIALSHHDHHLTYADLHARATQLAYALRARGVVAETPVALYLDRSPDLVVALLAVLLAGGCYVPLDPAYPPERVALILADAHAPVLLTHAALHAALPPHAAHTLCLDTDWPTIARQPTTPLALPIDPAQAAYVIYTSGSTGRPKGVLVTHAHVLRLFAATEAYFHFGAEDVWTLFHSIAFDFSVWELWGALLHGGRLVVVPYLTSRAPEAFYALLRQERVTVLNQTPSAFRQLIQAEAALDGAPADLALRYVIFGGEALDLPSLRPWVARHGEGQPQLINMYGITETTVHVTYRALRQGDLAGAAPSVIGAPLRDLAVYVLDAGMQPVPIGVPGEIYVGGAGVARGYHGHPALTAARFVPDPFGQTRGARLYRSGDLARYLSNGDLHYLGRIDQQAKIRGFRIELGEIEAALAQHPDVREAVVLLRDERLVAYVVEQRTTEQRTENKEPSEEQANKGPREQGEHQDSRSPIATEAGACRGLGKGGRGGEGRTSKLRTYLKEHLPEYMVPSAFIWLDAFPLTPNGKLDRTALPAPDMARPDPEETFVAPRTPIEEVVAGIWADVLGLRRVSIHDNFFDLGGHSLLATQILARVQDVLAVELSIRCLFETPTVAGLARQIAAARHTAAEAQETPLLPGLRVEPIPLSFAQQRLWFFDQLAPDSTVYLILTAVRLSGPLDVGALQDSLNAVVARHEALRTTFAVERGQPTQIIVPSLALALPLEDLSDEPQHQREHTVERLVTAETQRPFDLQRGPLIRAMLIRHTTREHELLLTLHHIVADGWSLGILVRELATIYTALAAGRAIADLPGPVGTPLPIQYADYTCWQRAWLQGPERERQLDYWRRRLAHVPMLDLPTDRPRPALQSFRGAVHHVALPATLAEALHALSRREGVTLFMTLLAAFMVVLQRYTGQTDLAVGTPVANRTRRELEPLIGFFVNTLVIRADLSGNPTFRDLLRQVREVTLDAYAHQDLPFEQLVEDLQPERDLSRSPLFQVLFVLQNTALPALALGDVTIQPRAVEPGTAKFDLSLAITETEQGLAATFEYNTDLFDPETIARLAGHFQTALEGSVAQPAARLHRLPLLTAAERDLLAEWNATAAPYASDACIHTLFETQATRTPDTIALVFESEALTYHDLDGRANRLARYLRSLGVTTEVRVGLCVEHGPEQVIGLLGILKAGGVYVPIDPRYPGERIRFMLEDARVAVLLTQHRLCADLPDHGAQVVCLDRDWPMIANQTAACPACDATADNVAYMIYTSGSTGNPKGVMVQHRSVCSLMQTQLPVFEMPPASRVLQFASLSFDASIWETFMTLLTGSTLVLAPQPVLSSGADLLRLLRDEAISVVTLPPSLLAVLPSDDLPALKIVITAGEACPASVVERWARGRIFFNAYGPTETTVCATATRCEAGLLQPPPIGRALPNAQVYLLDRQLQPVPVGISGEIFIGGEGLARGYWNRPDLTAERFVPNPFGELGARLYKTGDLARYLPDGTIVFLGRVDQQVKLRGYRIELGEIEAVLRQHEAVRDAVVLLREERGDTRLVAYVV